MIYKEMKKVLEKALIADDDAPMMIAHFENRYDAASVERVKPLIDELFSMGTPIDEEDVDAMHFCFNMILNFAQEMGRVAYQDDDLASHWTDIYATVGVKESK